MNKKSDLISVIVPVFNGEKYLPEFLESLANQTYDNFEVIFGYDTKSTDNTLELLKKFQKSLSGKHTVIIDEGNDSGLGGGRNRGLLRAKGTYFVSPDADDYLIPQYLEYLHDAFILHPEISVSICRCVLLLPGEDTQDILRRADAMSRHEIHLYQKEELMNSFTHMSFFDYNHSNLINTPSSWTYMVKRETIFSLNHLFIDSEVKDENGVIEDVVWTFQLLNKLDKIAHTHKILYMYRVHESSVISGVSNEGFLKSLNATCSCLTKELEALNPAICAGMRNVILIFILVRAIRTTTYGEWIAFVKEAFFLPDDDKELLSAELICPDTSSEIDVLITGLFNTNKHWCYVLLKHWYAVLAKERRLYPFIPTQLPLETEEEKQISRELVKRYPEFLCGSGCPKE